MDLALPRFRNTADGTDMTFIINGFPVGYLWPGGAGGAMGPVRSEAVQHIKKCADARRNGRLGAAEDGAGENEKINGGQTGTATIESRRT